MQASLESNNHQGHDFVPPYTTNQPLMDKDKKKIKEPFDPHKTPKPPQIIDPNTEKQRKNPIENKGGRENNPGNPAEKSETKPHLLSEESDISDETTI